ncbi:MAG: hypothetical protein ACRDT8_26930, partial [Micromonosporaceae bacterium]
GMRRAAIRPHLPPYVMQMVAALGQPRPSPETLRALESELESQLGNRVRGVALDLTPHGITATVQDAQGNVFDVLVTSGADYGDTQARIAVNPDGDRYVLRLPTSLTESTVTADLAAQLDAVLTNRLDGAPLPTPSSDPWAALHPHHFSSAVGASGPDGTRPSSAVDPQQRLAEQQAAIANQQLDAVRTDVKRFGVTLLEAALAAATSWRQAYAIENAYLDPTSENPYRAFNDSPFANLPAGDQAGQAPQQLGAQLLAELLPGPQAGRPDLITRARPRPGSKAHRRALEQFAEAAYHLLQQPPVTGQSDMVRTLLTVAHTEIFGYAPQLPADLAAHSHGSQD